MARIAFILLCHKDPEAIVRQARMLTAAGDYIAMGQLLPGVQLHTADYGAVATVASKSSRKGGFEVFNFEVEDTHNYYVRSQDGGPAVLVHNICLKPNDTLTAKDPKRQV